MVALALWSSPLQQHPSPCLPPCPAPLVHLQLARLPAAKCSRSRQTFGLLIAHGRAWIVLASPAPRAALPSPSPSSGASPSSLPRWRSLFSTLNWKPVREIEVQAQRSVLRTKRIEERTKQIEKETEQIRCENARMRHLISCVDQLCFLPESNSIPPTPTKPDFKLSSP